VRKPGDAPVLRLSVLVPLLQATRNCSALALAVAARVRYSYLDETRFGARRDGGKASGAGAKTTRLHFCDAVVMENPVLS
jgi:hypothetical protein